MKSKIAMGVLALLVAAFAAAAPRAPQSEPLTGTWKCTAHGGGHDDMAFTLRLQQNSGTVTGSVSSPIGDARISSGSFRDNHLQIRINGTQASYILTANYSGGKLAGNWREAGSDHKGTWEGSKGSQ